MRVFDLDPNPTPVEFDQYEQMVIDDEKTLESWIHANPQILLDEPLLVVGRQTSVDSGSPDLVAIDEYGNLVVIEVKIGKSGTKSASEETILGQPQAYASDYSTHTYDDLNRMYRKYQRRLAEGRWSPLGVQIAPGDSLVEAINEFFDLDLDESQLNTHRRMLIVAEEVTAATAKHVRDLTRHGLPMSCIELVWFENAETGNSVLAHNVVVDHDRRSVKPDSLGPPTYPDLVEGIVENIFEELGLIVGANHPLSVFHDGFDVRSPRLTSAQPWHPGEIKYRLAIQPDRGKVTIAIDNPTGHQDSTDQLLEAANKFRAAGFEVNGNASHWNLVKERWEVESIADLEDCQVEIGERFKKLVEIGHNSLRE